MSSKPSLRILLALLLVALLLPLQPARAAAPDWYWRRPSPTGADLNAVTYGNGLYVAVGDYGTVITSLDGESWTSHRPDTHALLLSVAYGAGHFVAVGTDGTILGSDDNGVTWTQRESGIDLALGGVTYGNGRFVAVGDQGVLLTSSDGTAWQRIDNITGQPIFTVAYGGGRFLAGGQRVLLTSTDGIAWQQLQSGLSYPIAGLSYGNGQFITMDGARNFLSSPDGTHWSAQPVHEWEYAWQVAYGGGDYVALGADGKAFSSSDGVTWALTQAARAQLSAITYGKDRFVAVGAGGTVSASVDGTRWTAPSAERRPDVQALAYGNGMFVAAGSDGLLLSSPDGDTWTEHPLDPKISFHGLAFGDGRFVAVGGDRVQAVSTDGVTWTVMETGRSFNGLTYGNGRFVAVADGGTATSADGLTWTFRPLTETPLRSVTYGGGQFVAVGPWNTIETSPDGVEWTRRTELTEASLSTHLLGVTYGGGRFVAVGVEAPRSALAVVSTDGIHWTRCAAPLERQFSTVAYDGTQYIAAGNTRYRYIVEQGGALYTSPDGIVWTERISGAAGRLYAVLAAGGHYFVAGSNGAILGGTELPAVRPARVCRQQFPDLPADHPACFAVADLRVEQVVDGFPDGTFRPDGLLTRAEIVKLFTVALHWMPDPKGRTPYTDTAGHWVETGGYLQIAWQLNDTINGFPDGTFRPDLPVTRAQLMRILVAAGSLQKGGSHPYVDIKPGAWYDPWVARAYGGRLIGPYAQYPIWTGERFEGDKPVTRAEAAIVLDNLLALVDD